MLSQDRTRPLSNHHSINPSRHRLYRPADTCRPSHFPCPSSWPRRGGPVLRLSESTSRPPKTAELHHSLTSRQDLTLEPPFSTFADLRCSRSDPPHRQSFIYAISGRRSPFPPPTPLVLCAEHPFISPFLSRVSQTFPPRHRHRRHHRRVSRLGHLPLRRGSSDSPRGVSGRPHGSLARSRLRGHVTHIASRRWATKWLTTGALETALGLGPPCARLL